MAEQGVMDVRRITVRRDGVIKLTNTYVHTFNSPNLPTVVKIGFMQVKVDVYIPNPLRVTIVKCLVTTKINVVDTLYAATAVSLNIMDHLACVTNQPNVSTAQLIILEIQNNAHNGRKRRKYLKSNVKTTYHFLKLINITSNFYTGQTYASALKPGSCNKSTQTDNKSTQTDDSYTEYLKKQATEKTQGTQEKSNSSPHPGKSNSSHPGPALKQAILDMMKKDEEKKKKEEKDKLKKQQKEERRQQYHKEQAQKEKKQHKKQNKLKRIHFL